MQLFTRRTRASRAWSAVASALCLALAFGAVGGASPAHAAETIVVDQSFDYPGNAFMFLNTQGDRWAQPFIPTQDGSLAEVSVVVSSSRPYEFASANLHEIPAGGDISAAPVTGGTAELTFAPFPGDESVAIATASFPDRPQLDAGTRYALVVDPRVAGAVPGEWAPASFPMQFTDRAHMDYFVWQEKGMVWGYPNYTGQLYFTVRLALPDPIVEVTPEAPTLEPSTQCDVPGTVTLPVQTGVEYTSVAVDTTVTVTARALDGYAFTPDAQASWTFSVAAAACPVDPIVVTPQEPTVVAATCDAPGSLTFPETPGIVYETNGPLSQTRVTATALEGYVLAPGALSSWEFDLTVKDCAKPTPETPGTETPSPEKPGSEKPSTVKPAARPAAATSHPVLAKTGSDSPVWPLSIAALLTLGAGALLVRRRDRRNARA